MNLYLMLLGADLAISAVDGNPNQTLRLAFSTKPILK